MLDPSGLRPAEKEGPGKGSKGMPGIMGSVHAPCAKQGHSEVKSRTASPAPMRAETTSQGEPEGITMATRKSGSEKSSQQPEVEVKKEF